MCTRTYLQALVQLSPLSKLFDYYVCAGAIAVQLLLHYKVMSHRSFHVLQTLFFLTLQVWCKWGSQ